jgi:hypothetical protein
MNSDGAQSTLRKIVITVVIGALSFPFTNLLFQSQSEQFVMSAGVGAIILIVQLLLEIERRLSVIEHRQSEHTEATRLTVEKGFSQVSEATELFGNVESLGLKKDTMTQLVQKAAQLSPIPSHLVSQLVQFEIENMSNFIRGLSETYVTYEGEDRNWLLSLSRACQHSIDAVSLPAVDAGGEMYLSGFWGSDLGHRYLKLQHEAVRRGVQVRRVFVIERPGLAQDPGVLRACQEQAALGIEVRLLDGIALLPKQMSSYDFILFDNELGYEVTPSARSGDDANPLILHTRLILDKDWLMDRQNTYSRLWDSAEPLP